MPHCPPLSPPVPPKRGAETWGFHESPSFPEFINLGRVSHECRYYQFQWWKMQPKIGAISFNEKVISKFLMNHVVLRESRSFAVVFHTKNNDSYVVSTGAA